MRMLFFGGSFNPVHLGHLHLAEEVKREFGYDRVLFIPSNISVHKENRNPINPDHRLKMLSLALSDTSFLLEDCEIKRGGFSYSIETVDHLKKHYKPTGKLGFILGDDLVPGFNKWKNAELLSREVDLLIAHRKYKREIPFDYPHKYCSNLLLPVSSSEIRSRIARGLPFRYLVPEKVAEYIIDQGLYRK